MVINYFGGQYFKITQGDLTIAFNPPSKDSNLKSSKFGADIVLISQDNKDFNGIENNSYGDKDPFVISGPGEYEVKGIAVRGFGAPTEYAGEHLTTLYSILLEGTNLCFLSTLSNPTLPQAAKQELDDIDILFLPIGGDGVLTHADAYKVAVSLEPKAIIPMHYDATTLKAFLKEAGAEGVKPVEKLTTKKKELEGKEGEIIVLES